MLWGCGLTAQTLDEGGLFFSQSGDRLITFGNGIHLTIRAAHGLSLAAFVEQFSQMLHEQTSYVAIDDQQFNREPYGYVINTSVAHHNTPFVLFADADHIYIFFARLSLACSDEQNNLSMEKAFWHATASFSTQPEK